MENKTIHQKNLHLIAYNLQSIGQLYMYLKLFKPHEERVFANKKNNRMIIKKKGII